MVTVLNITPAEVQARISSGESVGLIDIDMTTEWIGGHAVGVRRLDQLDSAAVVSLQMIGIHPC